MDLIDSKRPHLILGYLLFRAGLEPAGHLIGVTRLYDPPFRYLWRLPMKGARRSRMCFIRSIGGRVSAAERAEEGR
jgi:hypothetical protein